MKKIVVFMHVSLDGFVAGPNGEMNWIKANDELFDYAGKETEKADTALYGRKTYEMMQAYWPTAAEKPNATKHDIDHSRWYKHVTKVVLSRTMKGEVSSNTKIISSDIAGEISKLKQGDGKNILIFGSPSVVHSLMEADLIDEYWSFINPVILGKGLPLFDKVKNRCDLKLTSYKVFDNGVAGLHHVRI